MEKMRWMMKFSIAFALALALAKFLLALAESGIAFLGVSPTSDLHAVPHILFI